MKKGLKEMSESLSEELSKNKIDNCERVLISERCTIRKYSCNSDSIEFKDIRKKDR